MSGKQGELGFSKGDLNVEEEATLCQPTANTEF